MANSGPLQRRVHRQLVVGPLHRRQRRAQALDLFAQVEGAAADQQMGDAARLQRLDVVTRDVLAPRGEAPEQQAHVPRRDRQRLARPLALGDLPAALVQQPGDERAHGSGQRRLDGELRQSVPPVWLGDGQGHDPRLAGDGLTMRSQRHVAGLQRAAVVGHRRRERRVHEVLNLWDRAEARRQVDGRGTGGDQQILHRLVGPHVRAAEPVDRLLGIADEEELAGRGPDVLPAGHGGVRRRTAAARSRPAAGPCPGTRRRRCA